MRVLPQYERLWGLISLLLPLLFGVDAGCGAERGGGGEAELDGRAHGAGPAHGSFRSQCNSGHVLPGTANGSLGPQRPTGRVSYQLLPTA